MPQFKYYSKYLSLYLYIKINIKYLFIDAKYIYKYNHLNMYTENFVLNWIIFQISQEHLIVIFLL